MNEGSYYPIDPYANDTPPLRMDKYTAMAQLDVCGQTLSYVNGNIVWSDSVRKKLNKATFLIKEAYRELGKMKGEE